MKKPNSFAKKLFANKNYYENNHVIAEVHKSHRGHKGHGKSKHPCR